MSTKKFVWIGNRIAQERDANNTITRRYFAEGEQRFEGGAAGIQNYYYTRDHLGSIREVTDSAGTVLTRYDYDPYGKSDQSHPGKSMSILVIPATIIMFPADLTLTLYRAYHPALGRWISRDPMEEQAGLNLYQDVQNDPVNRIDPLGLLDFRYYGNWGGPGWTGAQRRPYEDLTPAELAKLAPPIDAQDRCYMRHDICYSRCRLNNGCASMIIQAKIKCAMRTLVKPIVTTIWYHVFMICRAKTCIAGLAGPSLAGGIQSDEPEIQSPLSIRFLRNSAGSDTERACPRRCRFAVRLQSIFFGRNHSRLLGLLADVVDGMECAQPLCFPLGSSSKSGWLGIGRIPSRPFAWRWDLKRTDSVSV